MTKFMTAMVAATCISVLVAQNAEAQKVQNQTSEKQSVQRHPQNQKEQAPQAPKGNMSEEVKKAYIEEQRKHKK